MANKSNYQWFKTHHICPNCCKNRPKAGRVYCEECLAKKREKQEKLRQTEEYKSGKTNSYKKLVDYRKKRNLCVRCGKPRFDDNKQYCDECLVKFREYNKKAYMKKAMEKFKNEH